MTTCDKPEADTLVESYHEIQRTIDRLRADIRDAVQRRTEIANRLWTIFGDGAFESRRGMVRVIKATCHWNQQGRMYLARIDKTRELECSDNG